MITLALAATLALTTTGCTALDNFLASIPLFSFLRESPAFDPYEAPRPPVPGTVPYEAPSAPMPPLEPSETALIAFGATVTNPVPVTEETVAQGQVLYVRFCAVCHGATGRGDGPVIGPGKIPFAPDLTLPVTVQRSDGYLYGIVRVGRGLMPPYGGRIPSRERWLVVNYVRQLQRTQAAGGQGQAPGGQGQAAEQERAAGQGQAAEPGQTVEQQMAEPGQRTGRGQAAEQGQAPSGAGAE